MKLLYLSELKWRYLRTRKQQMVRRFPANWRIFFVEPFVVGRNNQFCRQQDGNVGHLTVPYFKDFRQKWLRRLMSFAVVRAAVILANTCWLGIVLRATGFRKPAVVVVSNVYYTPVVRLLFKSTPVIYDCNDNHLAFPMTPAWVRRYFLALCRRADGIVYSSQALQEIIPPEHHHKAVLIGNGVDNSLFRNRVEKLPEVFTNLPRPILLYWGALSEWIDVELLERVAEAHPDKALVLIGPVAPAVRPLLARLKQKSNVYQFKEISHDRIASHLAAAEVCLIPFKKNELTRAVNPNKLYEYLAAGKAVVSMDISPEVIALGHEIFVAGDHAGFVRQIDAAVQAAHLRVEERRQLALANDWQEKAGQFSAVIVQIANKKRAASKVVLQRLIAGIPARFRRRRLAEGTQA